MVGIAEISAGLGSLKAAKEIVQGLNATITQTKINEVKIELQGLILEAQEGLFAAKEAQSAASQRIAELEQKVVQLEDWEADKERYELADTGQGSLAYKLKEGVTPPQPEHWICPNCYERGQKSLMKQDVLPQGQTKILVCHPCGLELVTMGRRVTSELRSGRVMR